MGSFIKQLSRVFNGLQANDGSGDNLRAGANDINASWDAIEQAVNSLAASIGSGVKPYATVAAMNADAQPDGIMAVVYADPTPANNTSYARAGGVWTTAYDRLTYAIGNGSGFQQQGAGAGIRPINDKAGESFSIVDYKAAGTDTQALQAAANALAALYGTGEVTIPAGSYAIGTVTLPDGIGIRALGKVTMTSVSGANMIVLGRRGYVIGVKFVGFGSGTTDIGVYGAARDSTLVQGCAFSGFRKAAVKFDNATNSGVDRCVFYGNFGSDSGVVVSAIEPDIYFNAACNNVYATNNIHIADPSRPKQAAIFISSSDPTKRWSNINVSNNFMAGYARGGVYPADENPIDGINSAYGVISGNVIVNSGQEAIKVKNCQFLSITGNVINGFETISVENSVSILQGGIFVNNSAGSTITGNVVIGSGAACTDGIHVSGAVLDASWTYTNTFSRWGVTVANNMIFNCGRYAVRADQVSQLAVTGNVALNCAGFIGCLWSSANPTRYNNNVTVTGNTYRGGTFAGNASPLIGAYFYNVVNLLYGHNLLNDCGSFGLYLQQCSDAKVSNSLVFNAGSVSGGATYGVELQDCTNVSVSGITSSNRNGGTTQTYGLRLAGTNAGISFVDSDLTGNVTGAVTGGTFPSDSLVRDVRGYLGSTISFTPGTIANGAGAKIGVSVPGAALGDFAEVSAPYALNGVIAVGYVKATDSCDIAVSNTTGASVTLAAGTWKIRVVKRPNN